LSSGVRLVNAFKLFVKVLEVEELFDREDLSEVASFVTLANNLEKRLDFEPFDPIDFFEDILFKPTEEFESPPLDFCDKTDPAAPSCASAMSASGAVCSFEWIGSALPKLRCDISDDDTDRALPSIGAPMSGNGEN
jgi:hypothetical protein